MGVVRRRSRSFGLAPEGRGGDVAPRPVLPAGRGRDDAEALFVGLLARDPQAGEVQAGPFHEMVSADGAPLAGSHERVHDDQLDVHGCARVAHLRLLLELRYTTV